MNLKMNNSFGLSLFFSVLLLLLMFTFISQISAKTTKCKSNDRKALLEIKAAFGNPYYLRSWDPNVDCCEWDPLTVICDPRNSNRVEVLTINQADISGQIPAAIGDLTYLKVISFVNNTNLTGTIPPSIVNLKYLFEIYLSNNSFSGPIPSYLSKLNKLVLMDLSNNDFTGSIPPEFSQFQNLQFIYLAGNKLTGTIPETFGYFNGIMQNIFLSNNHLTGTLPESLGNLNITYLDVSQNNLTGDPSLILFGKNKTVEMLILSENNFTFDLSKVVFPHNLITLDLSHNQISGSLPPQMTQLEYLENFNVSYNNLCGEIPQGGKLQNFDSSSYFHNQCLCGAPLPACT